MLRGEEGIFEICVGAILTQNTNWNNVVLVLRNMHEAELTCPERVAQVRAAKLQACVRASGYYRQKAKKLKIFSKYICDNYSGKTSCLLKGGLVGKREELLGLWGLGPETADSILLYAGVKPIFVIDAYTKRLCQNLGVELVDYDDYRLYFESNLPKSVKLYKEYHALIVAWGKLLTKDKDKALLLIK